MFKIEFQYGDLDGHQVNDRMLHSKVPPHLRNRRFRSTACVVTRVEDGRMVGLLMTGMAFCSPTDVFIKETGRKLALARALEGVPKDVRTMVWDTYFKRGEVSNDIS